MRGVQAAIFANDACAVPIPWELVCPWNYFDGKLFHSKYLMVADNVSLLELCDGKVVKNRQILSLHSTFLYKSYEIRLRKIDFSHLKSEAREKIPQPLP